MKKQWIEHFKAQYPQDVVDALAISLEQEASHALLLDVEKVNEVSFVKQFPLLRPHPMVPHAYLYKKTDYAFGKSLLFECGAFYLLDASALLVAHFLDPKPDEFILDCCAAPGGKTIHAAFLMQQKGCLIANEIQSSRASILASNVEKYGRKNILVTSQSIAAFYPYYAERFDKIILDAPCSGSGMFRKEPKMEEDWSEEKVTRLAILQKALIVEAFRLLKPGGQMVYSTCSFSKQENEAVVEHLLQQETTAERVELPLSPLFYRSEEQIGIHLFPHLFDGEGHYLCLLRKKGTMIPTRWPLPFHRNTLPILKNFEGTITTHEATYLLTSVPFDKKALHIKKAGIKLGTEDKARGFLFDHNVARYKAAPFVKLELTAEEAARFIEGHPLQTSHADCIVQLCYQSLPFAMATIKKGTIKNTYPKGLRKHGLTFFS